MASVAAFLPIMGARIDHYGAGAALRMMSILGAILVPIFLGLLLRFRSSGGYKRVTLAMGP
jgi:hypothetical protein